MFRKRQVWWSAVILALLAVGWWAWVTWRPASVARYQAAVREGDAAVTVADFIHAEACYRKALKEAQKFGPADVRIGDTYVLLAQMYHSERWRIPVIYTRKRQVLAAIWRALGDDAKDVRVEAQLARERLHANGAQGRSFQALKDAFAAYHRTYRNNDPRLAACLLNLAHEYANAGHFQKTREMLREALTVQEATYGSTSPKLIKLLTRLGDVEQSTGHLPEASTAYQRAWTLGIAAAPAFAADTQRCLYQLYNITYSLHDPPLRRTCLEAILADVARRHGVLSETAHSYRYELMNTLCDLGEQEHALRMAHDELALAQRTYKPGSLLVLPAIISTARIESRAGHRDAAFATYERGLTRIEAHFHRRISAIDDRFLMAHSSYDTDMAFGFLTNYGGWLLETHPRSPAMQRRFDTLPRWVLFT